MSAFKQLIHLHVKEANLTFLGSLAQGAPKQLDGHPE
jgi:hypothetical protein